MDISESGSQQKYQFLYPGYLKKKKRNLGSSRIFSYSKLLKFQPQRIPLIPILGMVKIFSILNQQSRYRKNEAYLTFPIGGVFSTN